MIVVSDSSPLITLSKIDHLHVLPGLYGTIHIAPAVFSEVTLTGAGLWGAGEVAGAEWVRVTSLESHVHMRPEDTAGLGAGEISAVLLARQLEADLVLMDDRKARALAVKNDVTPLGCIGILHNAFLAGLLTDLRRSYLLLLGSGAYVDRRIIEANLKALNLPGLDS